MILKSSIGCLKIWNLNTLFALFTLGLLSSSLLFSTHFSCALWPSSVVYHSFVIVGLILATAYRVLFFFFLCFFVNLFTFVLFIVVETHLTNKIGSDSFQSNAFVVSLCLTLAFSNMFMKFLALYSFFFINSYFFCNSLVQWLFY